MDEIAGKGSESANLPRPSGPKKKRSKRLLPVILAVVILGGARFYGMYEASRYGRSIIGIFRTLGERGMSDTERLRMTLAEPDVDCHARRVRMLGPLALDYKWRINDLQNGLIYFSEQFGLPADKRFVTPPPKLRFFRINLPSDGSDEAYASAVADLIMQYMSGI